MATSAAAQSFLRVWGDPEGVRRYRAYQSLQERYLYLWHLYKNSVFDGVEQWAVYRAQYGLYRHIRPVYNPTKRLVNFYAGMVYPGVLSTDGAGLPDGTPLAIPLAKDIDEALRDAIGQLWQWSNWQVGKSLMVRYGAALGDVLVEVVDEVDRGKVTFDIIWPGLVTELTLDGSGNVKEYAIEYEAQDTINGPLYHYKRLVNSRTIAEFKNDSLFEYVEGVPAERPNPYGFAPAVWCKHTDDGGDHGEPAIRNISKIDELNEMASHAHDRAHAVLSSPMVISGKNISQAFVDSLDTKRGPTSDQTRPSAGRESVRVLKAEENGGVSAVQLPEGEMLHYIEKLLEEIEADHPELTMFETLREMSQITGPAAEILVGDAYALITDARAGYDVQTVKLMQMGLAVAGWRLNTGAWGNDLSSQQETFAPFDLESYRRGDLDFEIMPRPLVPRILTAEDRRVWMEAGDRHYVKRETVTGQFVGDVETEMAGIAEDEAKDIADQEQMLEMQQQFAPRPQPGQPPR
jgi:hypothetical protein